MEYFITSSTKMAVLSIVILAKDMGDADIQCQKIINEHHKGKKCKIEPISVTDNRYYYHINIIESFTKINNSRTL